VLYPVFTGSPKDAAACSYSQYSNAEVKNAWRFASSSHSSSVVVLKYRLYFIFTSFTFKFFVFFHSVNVCLAPLFLRLTPAFAVDV
jgi:hypothetical protein